MGHNSRKKAVNLWKHTRRRLWFAGLGCPAATPEFEWALQCDRKVGGTYAMYLGAAAARFAPDYQNDDFLMLQNIYCIFSESYRTFRQAQRRKLKFPKPPRKSGLILLLLFAALAAGDSRAQDADPAAESNDLYQRGIMAEYSEFWERAIELFKEGGEKYPQDPRFPRALGRLYYSRSLYNLAWDEYRKTELINPYDTYVLYRLANTAGHLNRDKTAVAYLEKLLTIEPDNREAINNLGWMYYKIHRLKDGEQLLVSAIERLGEDADFAMTLATVYSDMYRYDEGKHWYQKAIALAEASSLPELWRGFIAVAHYNLSIVESRFYHFDRALDEANASIFSQNRASGLLARGELSMQRLDLQKALVDFDSAREIDSSPLAKLDLAQIYQISGRLEEARLYALDCLKASDQSWMINFGIDPIRYKRDLHNILYKTYSGLAMAERFNPSAAISDKIRSSLNVISFRFYSSVHRKLYQKYSLVAGDAYDETLSSVSAAHGDSGEPPLDQFLQYYNAFETYPHRALFYLNKAQNFETAIIPESAASYYLEKGILLKDKNLVTQALDTLNPAWEQELISKCYREFARRGPARANSKRQTAAEELFALNRGALLQAGIGLPLEINMYNAGKSENDLRQTLAAAGLSRAKTAARFRLDIVFQRDSASCGLFDTEDAKKPRHITIPLPSLSRTDRCAFARVLSNFVFKVE